MYCAKGSGRLAGADGNRSRRADCAERHERTSERTAFHNGTRTRTQATRMGSCNRAVAPTIRCWR